PERLGPIERILAADKFVTATGARIEHGGERAFYRPSTDHIQMPDEGLFCGTDTLSRDEGYYAVLLHELTHWTAPERRCNRDLSKRFLKAEVAAEELVAEIGAAMLCAELGVTHCLASGREQPASYPSAHLDQGAPERFHPCQTAV
ncbi:MAG: zincin-like metallopeptidase domain-containing protein, partial [Candidatus Saccharimonas sp.]